MLVRLLAIRIKRLLNFVLVAVLLCAARARFTAYSSGNVVRGGSRQLSAYVPLRPNAVAWSVNGIGGGDATVGTISNTGLYPATATVPAVAVTVRATSVANPAVSAHTSVTVQPPPPPVVSVSPTSASIQATKPQQFPRGDGCGQPGSHVERE